MHYFLDMSLNKLKIDTNHKEQFIHQINRSTLLCYFLLEVFETYILEHQCPTLSNTLLKITINVSHSSL